MQKSEISSYAKRLRVMYCFPYAKSVRIATNALKLRKALASEKFIHLTFKKLNGKIRKIWATTAKVIIPAELQPNGKGWYYTEKQVRFFDIELNEWRSCRIENIIAIV